MTPEKFNDAINSVSSVLEISPEIMFSDTREKHIVDARHIVFYLCKNRFGMPLVYIQRFCKTRGYSVHHATIKHGINKIENLISTDCLNPKIFK